MNARKITKALGGDWFGGYGLVPGIGHSARDRSIKVMDAADGEIIVHSFTGDDWRDIKAEWVRQGLLPEWQRPEHRDPQEAEQHRQEARERQQQRDEEQRADDARKRKLLGTYSKAAFRPRIARSPPISRPVASSSMHHHPCDMQAT